MRLLTRIDDLTMMFYADEAATKDADKGQYHVKLRGINSECGPYRNDASHKRCR